MSNNITVTERFSTRANSLSDRKREYVIINRDPTTGAINSLDEDQALGSLLGLLPTYLNGAPLLHDKVEVEEVTQNVFIGTAHWGYGSAQLNQFQLGFDISGQTVRITQSRQTVGSYKIPGGGAQQYNFQGAIGVNEDGTIDGAEIVVPFMSFELDFYMSPSQITQGYINTLSQTVGKTNSDQFQGYDVGELLLTKVSGSRHDAQLWEVHFGFSVSKNATNLSVGPITGISKKGWEYLWVYYKRQDINASGGTGGPVASGKQPYNAFVEQVYDSAAYGSLGIPSSLQIEDSSGYAVFGGGTLITS